MSTKKYYKYWGVVLPPPPLLATPIQKSKRFAQPPPALYA